MKMRVHALLLAACSMTAIALSSCSSDLTRKETSTNGIIDADDAKIRYTGRFDFSDPKKVVFDWAGVYICAKFEGTSCSVRLHDTTDEYAIIIDNHAPRLLSPDNSDIYRVASVLADSIPHTIMIQKRTEPLVGHGIFMGLILDKGAKLLPPDPRPDRRIEFIGNSITSGFGVMADSSNCHFSPQTENAAMAYAAMTARELRADYHLISYSGRGVVRNYGDSNKTSSYAMPSLYNRTCYFEPSVIWDFKKWIPQAVVINLGTNDFSTEPHPDKEVFQAAYNKLIDTVRFVYPGVTIFCVTGPMIEQPCTDYVREVAKTQQAIEGRDKDIFFVELPKSMMTDKDWGCDMHPNVLGAEKMADILLRAVRLRMNW